MNSPCNYEMLTGFYIIEINVAMSFTIAETEMLSLKYEHSRKEEEMTKNDREVRTTLETLVQDGTLHPDSARLFTKLIFAVRRLNMKALKSIWYRYYDCLDHNRCTKKQFEKYQ